MDAKLLSSLLDPAILFFFFFGLFAGTIRSNLEIPAAIAKFCSLYLLMVIGFKGGVGMAATGFNATMGLALLAAVLLAFVIPAYAYAILRLRLRALDAAAIAATYGSVSAVTFITASGFAERQGLPVGGYMTVALVLMESPAIIMAVLLANVVRSQTAATTGSSGQSISMKKVLHEAFTDGAHLLLLGSLLVGFLTGEGGRKTLEPFTSLQKGLLAFFLLDMGLLVAARARDLRENRAFLVGFGLCVPLVNAIGAAVLGRLLGLSLGDAFLLCVLAASASYIVVPAVVRYAIPEANASLYFGMSLVVTFPFMRSPVFMVSEIRSAQESVGPSRSSETRRRRARRVDCRPRAWRPPDTGCPPEHRP